MSFRARLAGFFASFALPHLALLLVFGQLTAFVLVSLERVSPEVFILVPSRVIAGEWWRLATFLLAPPTGNPYLLAFALYVFHLFGSALEGEWGAPRFNAFILLGWALTVAVSFLNPEEPTSNLFISLSVFLAFAFLAPDFELLLFFILPVKVKWIAAVAWGFLALKLALGPGSSRVAVIASVGNVVLFFRDRLQLWLVGWTRSRPGPGAFERAPPNSAPRHQCRLCEKNSTTHPDLDFRYCSKCAGYECYCADHIRNHEHVSGANSKDISARS